MHAKAAGTAGSCGIAAVRYTREALVSAQPAYPPNLAGKVLAIAYRDISEDGGPGSRTPAQLRADLERLLAGGYYPVNLRDVVEGKLSMVPAGKRPVVLTFDDSTPGQLRIRSNGAVEPETAVGVLLDFHAAHPADWPLKATFFVQSPPDGQELGEQIFGAPDLAAAKLQLLVDLGMEIGVQPAGQAKLAGLSSEEVQRVIAQSLHQLSSLLPDYKVVSLAVPEGRLPQDLALLRGGASDGETYALLRSGHAEGRADAIAAGAAIRPISPSPRAGERTGCLAEAGRQNERLLRIGGRGADRDALRLAPPAPIPQNIKPGAHRTCVRRVT